MSLGTIHVKNNFVIDYKSSYVLWYNGWLGYVTTVTPLYLATRGSGFKSWMVYPDYLGLGNYSKVGSSFLALKKSHIVQ